MLYNIVTIYEFTWFWVLRCNKVLDIVGWLDGRVQSSNGSNGWRNFSSASLCELCGSAGTYLTIESLLGRCTPPQTSLLPGGARRCPRGTVSVPDGDRSSQDALCVVAEWKVVKVLWETLSLYSSRRWWRRCFAFFTMAFVLCVCSAPC